MERSRHTSVDSGVPLSVLERVDQAGDRFEDAWQAGRRPAIETYLADSPDPDRPLLLRELLGLDLRYRCRAGETPNPTEYLDRFPEHAAIIHEAFSATPVAALRPDGPGADGRATPPERGSTDRSPTAGRGTTPDEATPPEVAAVPAGEWPAVPGYEVFGELGKGGMGVVYRARHRDLKRVVALKMIRAGAQANPEELARFRAEAAFQASLHHPHIVEIFEVGETAGGPYFALEYVEGTGLDKRIAGTPQPAPAAAQLAETLARAIHHAHEKGLVHRDLKPSNILMASDGTPKVGDFGLAKRLHGEPGVLTPGGQTQTGAVVGTPSYMAPEQAWGRVKAIGPAADIYALGAILYELLTGRPPFLGATAVDTVLQVRQQEPVPPRRWLAYVPRDLETICLKCLRKEPAKRYPSAAALADDLRRFLEGRPVTARPVGVWVRAVKWAKRRPAVAALVLALTLVVSGSLASLTVLWRQAEDQRDRAVKAEAAANTERDKAVAEKARGDDEAALSAAVRDFLQNDLLLQADSRQQEDRRFDPDPEIKVHTLLDRAAKDIGQRFQDRPLVVAAIRHVIGDAYRGIGKFEDAVPHLRAAHELRTAHLGADHPDTVATLEKLAMAIRRTGRHAEAIPLFERVYQHHSRQFGPDAPETLAVQSQLADVHQAAGHFPEAIRLYEQVRDVQMQKLGPDHHDILRTRLGLAEAYYLAGRTKEAVPMFEELREQTERVLGPNHADTLTAVHDLGVVYRDAGRTAQAIPLLEEARDGWTRKLGPDHPETLSVKDNLAGAYKDADRIPEAIQLLEQVRDGWTRKLGPDHPGNLGALNSLALAYGAAGRAADAVALLEQIRPKVIQRRGPDHPDTLAMLHNLAGFYRDVGRTAEAIALYEQVREAQARRLGPDHLHTLATLNALASTLQGDKQFDRAEALFRELLDLQARKLPADHPARAAPLTALGWCLLEGDKAADAEAVLRTALALREKAQPDHWTTFNTKSLLGGSLAGQQKYVEAEPLLLTGYEGLKQRREKIPANSKVRLSQALERLVQLYDAWGKKEQAEKWRKVLRPGADT